MEAAPGLVERARRFASEAHRGVGQLRKYTGQPYEEHLKRVAEIVARAKGDPEMVAAAWLHDVVEDTPVTIDDVEREFGPGVRELVDALTDVSRPTDGNRAARKAIDRDHLAQAPARAQTVKLADLIDNCVDICRHNVGFGRTFLAEMGQLLDVLTRADPALMRRARSVHAKWSQRLPKRRQPADSPAPPGPVAPRVARVIHQFANAFKALDVADALGPADAAAASAAPTQRVAHDAPLSAVVQVLDRHDACYVTRDGTVVARADRGQVQGPVVRMWLFGIVTTIEWMITEDIRAAAEVDWTGMISPGRLAKARALQAARAGLGRDAQLLDCLQLVDKIGIHRRIDSRPRPLLSGASAAGSQRLVRDLEALRNSLAHAQDIVTHDWTQVVRIARRLEELASGQ